MRKPEANAFIKYTGDTSVRSHTTPVSPLDAEKMLSAAVDPAIPDRALRFLILLACRAQQEPLSMTYAQIGEVMRCSERSAHRIVAKLEVGFKIRVERNGRRMNRYSLYSTQYASAVLLQPCSQCGQSRDKLYGVQKLCDRCRRRCNLKARLAAFRRDNPGQPLPMQYAGSKMSRQFLEVVQELDDEEVQDSA